MESRQLAVPNVVFKWNCHYLSCSGELRSEHIGKLITLLNTCEPCLFIIQVPRERATLAANTISLWSPTCKPLLCFRILHGFNY